MTERNVCAIFTSFRPGSDLIQNLRDIRSQVGHVVVVDNGSPPDSIADLLVEANALGAELIRNQQNQGIATALNQGAERALELGSEFLLFFDQDSHATPGMVNSLLRCYRSAAAGRQVGLLSTTNRERATNAFIPPLHDARGEPVLTMTAGSLLPASVFRRAGGFEDSLFIEFVDHEYCLRLRSLGYRILICKEAVLEHEVGSPHQHRLFGLVPCRTNHHRPERRYYFVRNLIVLALRYWRKEPRWSGVELLALVKGTVKIFIFEPLRMRKLLMSLRGVKDGLLRRMGERVPL